MRNHVTDGRKYVFVCGLHRSGTTVLGRNIATLEGCTGFTNWFRPDDEGQLLQDVYPIDTELGGAGRFGFDPRAHLTETSVLLTPEKIARLHENFAYVCFGIRASRSAWRKLLEIC